MTTKTVIVVQSKADGTQRYVTGGSGNTSEDIADAALFNSPENARPSVDRLLQGNIERKYNCELFLAEVEFVVVNTTPVARKPVAKGWVIRRGDGKYYQGPKTRNAKDFHEAHYKYVANPEMATAFPSQEIAVERARAIQAILDAAVDSGGASNRDVYLRTARTFMPTFEELL